jgi:PAS domain S-box-containing protein
MLENTDERGINQLETLRLALDASYDGIHILDKEGYTLLINKACERIEGISAEAIGSKNVQQLVEEGYFSESVTLKVLENKRPETMVQKVKNGNEVLVTGMPIYRNGEIDVVIVNTRDITELNNLKRTLNKQEMIIDKYHEEWQKLNHKFTTGNKIISQSAEMRKAINMALNVAKVESNILITGESGTGKGLLSKLIHDNSLKSKMNFIKIDCGAIPETLFESELFGFEKGAFTGADTKGKIGLVQLADKGTLFLDEIGEVSLSMQAKLLRLIQEKVIYRIGGNKPISVDVRIIAATNRNLIEMVKEGTFREDLYYRLNVIPIVVPSLKDRKEDIHLLVHEIIGKFNIKYENQKYITASAMDALIKYNWPGNVRELENIMERAYILTPNQEIDVIDLPFNIKEMSIKNIIGKDKTLKAMINEYEKTVLNEMILEGNNVFEIAAKSSIDVSTVRRKIHKHGLVLK